MPKVGEKEFPYTAAGVRAAKREQAKTAKPMKHKKGHVMNQIARGSKKSTSMGRKKY
jgi:hypothetical protein